MGQVILEAKNLSKRYTNKLALDHFNFTAEEGKIYGLLGTNGSGKTTFMKLAAGLLLPNGGEVLINGMAAGRQTKGWVSLLPDQEFLYRWMRVGDAVRYFADFFPDFQSEKAHALLEYMNLNPKDSINTLSKGMMERLQLTLILSRAAKVYLLDEPLAGIDPKSRDQIIHTIIKEYRSDSAVIISTHLVREIESVFDEVTLLHEGVVVLSGNAEALRKERGKSIEELFKEVFQ